MPLSLLPWLPPSPQRLIPQALAVVRVGYFRIEVLNWANPTANCFF